jgi:hypothetical protein
MLTYRRPQAIGPHVKDVSAHAARGSNDQPGTLYLLLPLEVAGRLLLPQGGGYRHRTNLRQPSSERPWSSGQSTTARP